MNELVTIVITTYGRPHRLKFALDSAIKQTYKPIEIVVVDDNNPSSEGRAETERLVASYKDVVYVKNKMNIGGALSRNQGIRRARGRFIAFLDDDDEYMPTKVQRQYDAFQRHRKDNVGLIYCYYLRKNYKGIVIGECKRDYEGRPIYEHMASCIAETSLWFASKEALVKSGYFTDTPNKQDSIMLLKLLTQGYTVYRVPEFLVYYYEHNEGRISGTKNTNITGCINYRDLCRMHYGKLDSRIHANIIECKFSKDLISLYVLNDRMDDAKNELKNIIRHKPFSRYLIISIPKVAFPYLYKKLIHRKRYQ